ncbi:hypothetical protein ACWEIJ_14160 [Lentzea sp. NPDC004789]
MTEPRRDDVEEQTDAPITPAEEETPSGPGAGLDGGGRYGDDDG